MVENLDGKDLRAVKSADFDEIGRKISESVLNAYENGCQGKKEGNCFAMVTLNVNGMRIVPFHKRITALKIKVQYYLYNDENYIVKQIMCGIEKWCKLQNAISVISKKCSEHFLLYGHDSGEEYLIRVLDGVFNNSSQVNEVLDDFKYICKWATKYIENDDIVKKNDIIIKYMYDSINSNLPYSFEIGCEADLRKQTARVFTTMAIKDPSRCELALNYFTTGEVNEAGLALAKVVRKKYVAIDKNCSESKYKAIVSAGLFYRFIREELEDNEVHCFITYLSLFIMEVRNKYELPDVIKNEITLLYR